MMLEQGTTESDWIETKGVFPVLFSKEILKKLRSIPSATPGVYVGYVRDGNHISWVEVRTK
jgi:hypothetical protein